MILDPTLAAGRDLLAMTDAVLDAGVRWIQLRAKHATTRELLTLAGRVGQRVRAAGGLLIVNDRVDVALAVGAGGVHLGQDDLPVAEGRRLGGGLVLGVSTHGLEQACAAEADGADYVALGSIFPTGSKASFELVGLETLARVRARVAAPLVAIGGITLERVPAVLAAGADGIAVLSAVGMAPDPGAAAAAFLAAIRAARRHAAARGASA